MEVELPKEDFSFFAGYYPVYGFFLHNVNNEIL